jgi:hypothetical protein
MGMVRDLVYSTRFLGFAGAIGATIVYPIDMGECFDMEQMIDSGF